MRDSRHFAREVACLANFAVERLDHLGIVAGVCQVIGLVEYFDGLDEREHARVPRRKRHGKSSLRLVSKLLCRTRKPRVLKYA